MGEHSIDPVACANEALEMMECVIGAAMAACPGRTTFHIVVLDPRKSHRSGEEDLPIILEHTCGESDPHKWPRRFDIIARSKADIAQRARLDTRKAGECAPWLLEGEDTKFPGGIYQDGLVVAGSGLEWQFDEACCKVFAALFWAICRRKRDTALADPECIFFGTPPNEVNFLGD